MKLDEIAEKITEHLNRFEADKKINKEASGYGHANKPYYFAYADRQGNKVFVKYISYQRGSFLSKAQAERYLAWLDDGNIGKHHHCFTYGELYGKGE